jgi:hypothetical protein
MSSVALDPDRPDFNECRVSPQGHIYVKGDQRTKLGIKENGSVQIVAFRGWLYLLRPEDLTKVAEGRIPWPK